MADRRQPGGLRAASGGPRRKRQRPSDFTFSGRVQFLLSRPAVRAEGGAAAPSCEVVALVPAFCPAALCREIVTVCEASAGFRADKTDVASYPQATVDVEVDRCPSLRHLLRTRQLLAALDRVFLAVVGRRPAAFDDIFVVKYSDHAGGQRDLLSHVDGGEVSWMLALSQPDEDFAGGGTLFADLGGDPLRPGQGDLLVFHSHLYHQGMPIRSGVRYLLVGFAFVSSPKQALVPGRVDRRFAMVRRRSCVFRAMPPGLAPGTAVPWAVDKDVATAAQQLADKEESLWVDAQHPPRGRLERMAWAILGFHCRRMGIALEEVAGAEYWAQSCELWYRAGQPVALATSADGASVPSPGPAGSGAAFAEESDSIPWHFDKDEALYRRTGMLRHPLLSTVTYLSDLGTPTVVIDDLGGDCEALIAYPTVGSHLAFDGRLLHGCPLALAVGPPPPDPHSTPAQQGHAASTADSPGFPRLTFLVNIWLGEVPERFAAPRGASTAKRHELVKGGEAARPMADWDRVGDADDLVSEEPLLVSSSSIRTADQVINSPGLVASRLRESGLLARSRVFALELLA